MPSFNVLTPILNLDGHPLRDGTGDDPKARTELLKLRAAHAAASEAQRPDLELKMDALVGNMQPQLTVGRAVSRALTEVLKGDEEQAWSVKLDLYELAQRVRKCTDICTTSETEYELIKERIVKAYPSALVVGQVAQAMNGHDKKE